MAILQPAIPRTFNTQNEVATRVILLTRDVIDNKNGSIITNFGCILHPHSIDYELDVNNNKTGIYDESDLPLIVVTQDQLNSLFGIKVILADGTVSYLGEVISNFADQIISTQIPDPGTITTQNIDIISVLTAQNAPPPQIAINGNVGIAGATLSWTDGSDNTFVADETGNYSITVSNSWSGTITPTLDGYTFTPINTVYTTLTTDQINQNYIATVIG